MCTLKNTSKSLWVADDGWSINILDQTKLPHEIRVSHLRNSTDAANAIRNMQVRGAPLIGVTAAYGMALALREDPSDDALSAAYDQLIRTRPTAVNLRWALDVMRRHLTPIEPKQRAAAAYHRAAELVEHDIVTNRSIGEHGLDLLHGLLAKKRSSGSLQIMTHCNAGRIATLDWGTATAPVYFAHAAGLPVHVWVSETRPRNQGAALTAWELQERGIPLTVIADNSSGHLLQRGLVDVVIVGADRVTARGDVANKIGTYLKALAAHEHSVPFYVACPTTTIDWTIQNGLAEIPIEQRNPREVTHGVGCLDDGNAAEVRFTPADIPARNDAFDVTPARFITGLITEYGVCNATVSGLRHLHKTAVRRVDC